MVLKYCLLFSGLVIGLHSKEICNFEKDFCNWAHLYSCLFIHETSKPLAGEKGYLYLSENTCEKAGITFPAEKHLHKFQLHYFINGTGSGMIAVSADYYFSGRTYLWSCNMNQGPHWNKADILVLDEGSIDWLTFINIEAMVSGHMTVAIGNVSPTYTGNTMSNCPRPRVTNVPKTTTRGPTTNAPMTTTTSNFITSSADRETQHSTEKAAVTNQDKLKTTGRALSTFHISTSKQNDQKDATVIPAVTVTARDHPNLTTTTGPKRSTILPQDLTTSKSASGGINGAETGKLKQQQGSKSKQGAIIGGSVFAVVFVIVVTVIGVLVYKRKIKMWDVQSSTAKGLENPLYR